MASVWTRFKLVALAATSLFGVVRSGTLRGAADGAADSDVFMSEDSEQSKEVAANQPSKSEVLMAGAEDIMLPWLQSEELIGAKHIHFSDANTSLGFELSKEGRVQEFKKLMMPYYAAWPKDADGYLEPQTVRYVLHRLFVSRHHWYVKGLELNGPTWQNTIAEQQPLKDWAPAYLLQLMEERLHRKGLDLGEVASVAAAIEDLVHKEAEGSLGEIFNALHFSTTANQSRPEMHKALSTYMVLYLASGMWSLPNAVTNEFSRKHSYWNATEAWFSKIESGALEVAGGPERVDFAMTARIAKTIGANYGSYNDAECQKQKQAMMNMWGKGKSTGRVRLVDFYRLGLDSEWSLAEKPAYLRTIGALDESNESSPKVIIPNYLQAFANCVQATKMYAICCRSECEDLMAELESKIAAPSASPGVIASVISALATPTVTAPRELSPELLARLRSIADRHGGQVNLHGRLFAQWMHHAYPSECPYPHEAGGTNRDASAEQMMSGDIEASEEERRQHVEADSCGPEQAAAEWAGELPWSDGEELLSSAATARLQLESEAPTMSSTAYYIILLVGVLFAAASKHRAVVTPQKQTIIAFVKYHSRALMLSAIISAAFALNLVNRFLIIFIVCGGLITKLSPASQGGNCLTAKSMEFEKCAV